jgi:hypothetical protein
MDKKSPGFSPKPHERGLSCFDVPDMYPEKQPAFTRTDTNLWFDSFFRSSLFVWFRAGGPVRFVVHILLLAAFLLSVHLAQAIYQASMNGRTTRTTALTFFTSNIH